jgi:hypothetical protein
MRKEPRLADARHFSVRLPPSVGVHPRATDGEAGWRTSAATTGQDATKSSTVSRCTPSYFIASAASAP